MIQCKDCKYFETTENGQKVFKCDPFSNIVEPQCLEKWQLLRLDMLASSYQKMLSWYEQMAPMQNKIFKFVQQQINDVDESEKWKYEDDQNPDEPFLP